MIGLHDACIVLLTAKASCVFCFLLCKTLLPTLNFLPYFSMVFATGAVSPVLQCLIHIETLKKMVKHFSSEHQYKLTG